jgi:hypothetical protein
LGGQNRWSNRFRNNSILIFFAREIRGIPSILNRFHRDQKMKYR